MIAAGVGCRRGCDAAQILDVLARALQDARCTQRQLRALFAPDWKRTERGLMLAAEQLQLPLFWLPLAQLREQAARVHTHSARVLQAYGVPSIAETAALAGAASWSVAPGPPQLMAARASHGAATCALARSPSHAGVT